MKKNLLNLMAILMVAIVSVGFVSCSDDDDDKKDKIAPEKQEITLLGIWYGIEGANVVSYQYNADGTGIFSYGDVMVKFSYSYDSNAKRLTQTVMGESYVYEITTLTAEEMVGKNIVSGGIRKFTRVEPEKPLYEKDGILYVNVYEAGVFPDLIEGRKQSTARMKISGSLNGTDIISLRDMMISDKGGKLVYLDMSDASIVEGGDPYKEYYDKSRTRGWERLTTQNNTISEEMFEDCDTVQELVLPNSVVKISHYMFGVGFNSNIRSITIGKSTIGSIDHDDADVRESLNVLAWMDKLEEIRVHPDNQNYSAENGILFNKDKTILYHVPPMYQKSLSLPNTLTTIGGSAFLHYKAASIKLPNSVRKLKKRAFWHSQFRTIYLGSIDEIEDQVFMDCDNLQEIYIDNPTPPIVSSGVKSCSDVFDRYYSDFRNIKLYVPKGSKEKYASTIPWSELTIIEV